ncbi:hypothetical protein ACLKA6_010414 [Drosophila palustris]
MSSGDKPRRKSISDSTRKPTPGPTVKPSPSSLRLQPSTKAPTPNIKKSLSPSTKSESLKTPTPKITRSITQSQQGRSKMALDDFIAASDRLSHFEAILAGSSQTVPSLSSLRIRRDQVQNIWAIIEQEYGRCSKALREDPSNAKDLTAIQANTPGSPAGARTNAGNAAKTITRSSTCASKAARPRGSLAAPLSQAPRSDTAVRRHGKAVPGTGAVHHHGVGHLPLHGPPHLDLTPRLRRRTQSRQPAHRRRLHRCSSTRARTCFPRLSSASKRETVRLCCWRCTTRARQ